MFSPEEICKYDLYRRVKCKTKFGILKGEITGWNEEFVWVRFDREKEDAAIDYGDVEYC